MTTQYLYLGVFLWKWYIVFASYKEIHKLQSFCLCTPLLTLTFTLTVFLFRHLPTEIVILINVCYQMKCFSGDSGRVSMVRVFPFLGAGFANIPPTFLISCEVQTRYSKTLKYSKQYIRDHLSGTKVRIWICSEYDFLYCFVQPNQFIHFLFHIIFIIRIRLWIFQTVNLYFLCFWNIAL